MKTTFLISFYRIYEKKLWAVIKIQSHIRRMIAIRQYRKMRVSVIKMEYLESFIIDILDICRLSTEPRRRR